MAGYVTNHRGGGGGGGGYIPAEIYIFFFSPRDEACLGTRVCLHVYQSVLRELVGL